MDTILTNDASTTLAVSIGTSENMISVSDGSQFPAGGKFQIRIDDEIMWVTAVSGNNWTVTRAAEPVVGIQTAAAHTAGVGVFSVLTVDAMTSGATPGSYTNPVVELDAYGRLKTIEDGTNRFFSGFGAPNNSDGLPGDYYLDIATSFIYLKS